MRRAKKLMLWAFCAAPVVAGMVMTGVGTAGATTLNPSAQKSFNSESYGPGSWGHGCSYGQYERWDLNGANVVDLTYQAHTYSYAVTFHQHGSCLTGTLTDTYDSPTFYGSIYGTVNGNDVTFSVRYPTNSVQGKRTFTGEITRAGWRGKHGEVSGTWSETGSENGSGSWYLGTDAIRACSVFHGWWWARQGACPVW